MRNIWIITAFLFISLVAWSQTQTPEEEQLFDLQRRISETFKEEDYQKGLTLIHQSLEFYSRLNEEMKRKYQSVQSSDYYNLACLESMLKNKKKALDAFEKAFKAGYINYQHAAQDSDLDYIRQEKQFIRTMKKMRKAAHFLRILREAAPYVAGNHASAPQFVYEPVENRSIRNVRNYFKLDSVAGDGDEISRIIRLLNWAHNTIPHDGSHWPVCEIDAISLYNYSKANKNRGINCRALAIFLNECYLSMGIPSRFVTCLPKDPNDSDCHVINAVYSQTLDKWVWMDPTFNAWVTDENGTLLGIQEVRERMINDQPYFLNEEANWNHKTPQTKEYYLDQYMAKNLYWLSLPARSIFNVESRNRTNTEEYVSLVPEGFYCPDFGRKTYVTSDPTWFWQKPQVEN